MGTNSLVTGRQGEYKVISKFMEHDLLVYIPIVDIEGIDCIIHNQKNRLIKIQIKTRLLKEKKARKFIVSNIKPDEDTFVCCYYMDKDDLWVIPSIKFCQVCYQNTKGHYELDLGPSKKRLLSKYAGELGIDLLKLGSFNKHQYNAKH